MGYVLVFLGGGTGAICRYVATTLLSARFGSFFPLGTFFVNACGSFLMGFLTSMLLRFAVHDADFLPETWRLLLAVGFLGGFTTFSSFSMDTLLLINGSHAMLALVNVLVNVFVGLVLAWLGFVLARFIF